MTTTMTTRHEGHGGEPADGQVTSSRGVGGRSPPRVVATGGARPALRRSGLRRPASDGEGQVGEATQPDGDGGDVEQCRAGGRPGGAGRCRRGRRRPPRRPGPRSWSPASACHHDVRTLRTRTTRTHRRRGRGQAHEHRPAEVRVLGDLAPQAGVERRAERAGRSRRDPAGRTSRGAPATARPQPSHSIRRAPGECAPAGQAEGEEGEAADEQRQADVPDEAATARRPRRPRCRRPRRPGAGR